MKLCIHVRPQGATETGTDRARWREVIWSLSWRADPTARVIADRHYNRQSVGAAQFVPPGRCLVLSHPLALWVTSWPFAEWVKHRWPGAWVCSAFRNEGAGLSSSLIRDAVAATRWRWPTVPALGMVTFVDAGKVRRKRDPGRCFLRAGFEDDGMTEGGLLAFRLRPEDMPEAEEPMGAQQTLDLLDRSPTLRHADPEKANQGYLGKLVKDEAGNDRARVDARTTEQSYADREQLDKARRKRALAVLDGGK